MSVPTHGVAGDTYNFTLTYPDGVTPIPLRNITSATMSVEVPNVSLATGLPITFPGGSYSLNGIQTYLTPVVQFVTTALSPFPTANTYQIVFIITYGSGVVAVSRIFTLVVA